MLALDCTRRLGGFTLDVALVAPAGSTLVLVGESGAGKTTIVNLVAGLLHPDRGTISVDGVPWFDAARGVAVPPHARPVATVMQDYALFPHLSVFENVAFGLRAQRLARGVCRARTAAMLAQLGIAALAPRRPAELSGGQQQRVALARALVLEPRVLLLDEPLAALDRGARRAVAAELRRLLATIASINLVVTHDPFEALLFGDTIAVVEQGRIVQSGPRHELLSRPRARSVAELMALNFFRGRVIARAPDGLATVACAEGTLRIACAEADAEGDELFVAVDPRDVTVHTAAPSGSAQNVFAAAITELVPEPPLGERVRVVLDTTPPLVAEVTAHAVHALALREGARVWASFKAVAARGYR